MEIHYRLSVCTIVSWMSCVKKLHQVAKLWNLHQIRPSVNNDSLPGPLDLLYFIPQATDTINCATPVDEDDLDISEYLADVTNASNSPDPAFTKNLHAS